MLFRSFARLFGRKLGPRLLRYDKLDDGGQLGLQTLSADQLTPPYLGNHDSRAISLFYCRGRDGDLKHGKIRMKPKIKILNT